MTNTNQAVNGVEAAIAAAKAAAAQTPAPATAVAINQPQAGAVAAYQPAPRKIGLFDLGTAGLSVDDFIKVSEDGLKLKSKTGLVESIKASIDVPKINGFTAIKYGSPVVYVKSYDGVKTTKGTLWIDEVAKVKQIDPKAEPYEGVDLEFTALEDVTNTKGEVLFPKGTKLGHSTSTTNKGKIQEFSKKVLEAGLENSVVEVKITSEVKKSPAYTWAVLALELIGPHTPAA